MINVSIARRYARALFEVAAEASQLDLIAEQLHTFADWVSGDKNLHILLSDPAYTKVQRLSVVTQLLTQAEFQPLLANFLKLLVQRHRTAYLIDIERLYREMADAQAGRIRGRLTSAVALSEETQRQIKLSLERLTQRDVILESQVDPSLLGGVSAQLGSFIYDGSVRSQLEGLRRALQQG